MVMDRSGHRMAGPAMSYGAKYFDSNGNMIVDDGFKTFAQKMVDWHTEGLMPADIWPAVSGSKYANGNEMFFNQDVPFYMSGSWNVTNVMNGVGDVLNGLKFQFLVVLQDVVLCQVVQDLLPLTIHQIQKLLQSL